MGDVQHQQIDICILIPCFNNFDGLVQSINSIVYPSGKFMVLVVDDGSAVAITRSALFGKVSMAVNIQVIRLRENQGITKALNKGLDFIYANYLAKYIARLDSGDTCHQARFTRQVAFLEDNQGIDLLGTWCYFKDRVVGPVYEYITPTEHASIERSMYFRNVFIHPTIMWRATSMETARYPENFPHAEDYGWCYDMISTKKAAILDDFLVVCEINKGGISVLNRSAQLKSRLKVIWHYGENRLLVVAGVMKLILLMALPHRFITKIKTTVSRYMPRDHKNL